MSGRKSLVLLISAVLIAPPLQAGINKWTGGGPEGGSIHDIVSDPSVAGQYYIGTTNGVFKSTDDGATWTRVAEDANRTIDRVVVANDGVVYALSEGETGTLFRSSDGGATWTELSVPAGDLEDIAVAPTNSNRLTLSLRNAFDDELYLSTNGGASFNLSNSGLPNGLDEVAFDPTTDQTAYCAAIGGVFKTTDGGSTWTLAGAGLTFNPQRLAVAPGASQIVLAGATARIAVSTDGGSSWTEVSGGVSAGGDVAIAPSSPLHMATLGGGNRGLYLSLDGGASWTPEIEDPGWGPTWNAARSVVYGPSGIATLLIASRLGVRVSADSGSTWDDSSSGINAAYEWTRVASSSPAVAYEIGGRVRSVDSGDTWTPSNNGLPQVSGYEMGVDSTDPEHAVWMGPQLFETTDGGRNWTDITPSLFDQQNLTSIDLDAYDPQRWVLSNMSWDDAGSIDPLLAVSLDGGSTWQTRLELEPSFWHYVYSTTAAFSPDDPNLLLVTGSGLRQDDGHRPCWVQRSDDGGVTWTEVLSIDDVNECFSELAIDPTDSQKVYLLRIVGEDRSLRQSLNGGLTWTPMTLPFGDPFSVAVNPVNGELYVGSDTLYRSADDGATWEPFPTVGMSDQVRFVGWIQVSSTNPPTLWISTNAGTFTYTGVPDIFADGFESGDTSAWSATVP